MNFLNAIAGAGNASAAQRDAAIQALQLLQAQQAQKGRQIYGKTALDVLSGGGRPQMPGAVPMPAGAPTQNPLLPGGGAAIAQPISKTPQGIAAASPVAPAPSVSNAAPGAPQVGAPQGNGLTWQAIASAIKKQAPDADGAVIANVIDQYAPMMSSQAKQDWQLVKLFTESAVKEQLQGMKNEGADDRNRDTNQARRDVANINKSARIGAGGSKLNANDAAQLKILEDEYKSAEANYRAMAANGNAKQQEQAATVRDAAKAKLDSFSYKKGGSSGGDTKATPPAGAVPVPPEAADQPDGATATDEQGNKWVKQGNYMIPAE